MTSQFPEVISLNIGGRHFETTLSTLLKYEDSMLAAMFSGRHRVVTDKDGRYFIDRDGSHFGHILEFLRQDKLPPQEVAKAVLEDAEFYALHQLSEKLKKTSLSVPLFVEEVLMKRRADFLEAHPKLASVTLDVIDEARKKFQENPTKTTSVSIWIPSQTFPIGVIRGSVHDCSVGCLVVEHIPDHIIDEYRKCSSSYLQECGYKAEVKKDQHCSIQSRYCSSCQEFMPAGRWCPRCGRSPVMFQCGSQKLCFQFMWSLVNINSALSPLLNQ